MSCLETKGHLVKAAQSKPSNTVGSNEPLQEHNCPWQIILVERFHMMSRQPYWCSKTKEWWPFWCTKPFINLFFHAKIIFCFSKPIWLSWYWWAVSARLQSELFPSWAILINFHLPDYDVQLISWCSDWLSLGLRRCQILWENQVLSLSIYVINLAGLQ